MTIIYRTVLLLAFLGLGQPDWELEQFQKMISTTTGTNIPSMPSPGVILLVLFVITLVTSPILSSDWYTGFYCPDNYSGYLHK